jgi:DNA adenine methylase
MLQGMSYPGGKNGSGVYQTLINLMPPHDVYIEPFLGGAAIMRLKRPARLNIGIDADPAPVETARLAGPQPGKNGDTAGSIARSGGFGGRHLRRRREDPPARSPANSSERAHLGFVCMETAFRFSRIFTFTGAELVYADPPYLMSTRSGRKLYNCEMSDVDHRRLLRVLRTLKCRVIISGYSSPLYAKELKEWNAASFQTTTRGGRPVAEWVWYNYPRPVELHDYRFLGSDYRERERIKRKKRRWVNRLATMPTLERQALLSAIAETAG